MHLVALGAYMVVVMVEMPHMVSIMVQMQFIMVLAAAVVPTILIMTPILAMEGLVIKV